MSESPVLVPSHWLRPGAVIPVTSESVAILRDALLAALAARSTATKETA